MAGGLHLIVPMKAGTPFIASLSQAIGVPGELARWGEDEWAGAPRDPLSLTLPPLSVIPTGP